MDVKKIENVCLVLQLIDMRRWTLQSCFLIVFTAAGLFAQTQAEYVGGTAPVLESGRAGVIDTGDDRYFAFYSKGGQVRLAYDQINLVEYGQKVDRRLLEAIVISPMFLLARTRKHFLSLGYAGEDGKQQALVFRVNKKSIRAVLVILEARTGLKIQYQDLEARKGGKG